MRQKGRLHCGCKSPAMPCLHYGVVATHFRTGAGGGGVAGIKSNHFDCTAQRPYSLVGCARQHPKPVSGKTGLQLGVCGVP